MKRSIRRFPGLCALSATLALAACGGNDLVGEGGSGSLTTNIDGGVTNGGIIPPVYTNVTLNSHIPDDGSLVLEELYVTENPSNKFVYGLSNSVFNAFSAYRAEDIGQTMLDDTNYPLSTMAVSGNNNIMVHIKSGMQVIDILTGDKNQIAASEGLFYVRIDNLAITDNGSHVAFIVDENITTENPDFYYQIFTLATDGSDAFTQVSSFTANYFTNISPTTVLAISGNGNTIFFHSKEDVLGDGSNADGSDEIFSISSDGTGLTQLTSLDLTSSIIEIETDSAGKYVAFLTSDSELYSFNTTTNIAVLLDTPGKTVARIIGPSIAQFDISANGNVIYYSTTGVPADYPTMHEKLIIAVNPDGTNKQQVFTSGPITGGSYIMSPQPSADGSRVSFLSSFDFGLTVAGEHETQVYTMTP